MFLGMGHLPPLWATCSSVLLPPLLQKNFFLTSSLKLPSFSSKPLPLVLWQQALLKGGNGCSQDTSIFYTHYLPCLRNVINYS